MKLTKQHIIDMTANGMELPEVEDINDVIQFCSELIEYINQSENDFWAAFESPDVYPGKVVIDSGHKSALRVMVTPGQLTFTLGDHGMVGAVAFAAIGVIVFTLGYCGVPLDLSGLSPLNEIPEGGKTFVDNNSKDDHNPDEFDWI